MDKIPDCYDPCTQAEDWEYKWDAYLARLPSCHRCGRKIIEPKMVYIEEHDEFYCFGCIEVMTEYLEL